MGFEPITSTPKADTLPLRHVLFYFFKKNFKYNKSDNDFFFLIIFFFYNLLNYFLLTRLQL